MSDAVLVEHIDGVSIITVNRPEARNAVNHAVTVAMTAAMDELDADDSLTIGILTGAGGNFSAGMDLKAFLRGEQVVVEGRGLAGLCERPPRKPLIAAVEGWALAGGCELALACDLIVAAEDARFGIPEVKRGLIAAAGGLLHLPRRLPPAIAMELALTGDPITAQDAHRYGLVNHLTPPGGALGGALALARRITPNGPLAVAASKQILTGARDWTLEQGFREQAPIMTAVLTSADAREGATAFAEKRSPSGRDADVGDGTDELQGALEGGRLTLCFNRPKALNALTPAMLQQATERVEAAANDTGVRVVVITGAGRAFSSGADIASDGAPDGATSATLDWGNALVQAIVHSPKPVVAAVNGLAAGIGATIALACDLHVVRRSAYLLLAFANIGLMPDGGATAVVPAAIGRARASRMALLAERIPAAQALEWGLISHVVDDDSFDDEVAAVADKLAGGPTLAYARAKAAIVAATLGTLDQAQALEREGQFELFDTADFAEGTAAFHERRSARFTGR